MNFEKLYKKLFVLPTTKKIIFLFATLIFFLALFERKCLLFTIFLLFTLFASKKVIKLNFNIRRVLFLAFLISILASISLKISGSFLGAYFLLLAVIYFCSEKGLIPSAIVSSIPFLLIEPHSIPFILISSSLFYIYLRYLDFGIDFSLREYLEGFIRFWLTNNPIFMESVLKKYSKLFEGRIRCLSFGNAKIISSDFHPGPFRNIGGAKLLEALDFPNSIYLHSPSTHEMDPVSEDDVIAIKEALRCDGRILRPKRPFEIEGNSFKIFCFPFEDMKLILVSGKKRIDDFLINSPNFVIDCHNADFHGDLSQEEIEEIKELVKKAEEKDSEYIEVRCAFVKLETTSESISRYVSAILFECGEKYAIVVFDSNNVDLKFREIVEIKFAELGFRTIVCSTDNHSKTGIKVKESYKSAGNCTEDYLILENLVNRCKRVNFEKTEFRYSESRVTVKVLGETIKKLERIEGRSDHYLRTFLLLTLINLLLPLAKII
ncbi:MAG: DUF2070 family protein [Archaeoglobaceae archaeon]|nr:DUF2070 family protein [Archaeoglobaceae archaeon]